MSPFHRIDLLVIALALVAGGVVASLGIIYNRDLVGVAAALASLLAPISTAYGLGRSAEWKARAADQSSMVEQEKR